MQQAGPPRLRTHPAPRWTLQEAAERLGEVEARAAKMAMELADFKTEATTLRNQDLTVRRLEERKKALEAQLAEKVGHVGCRAPESCCSLLQTRLTPAPLTASCHQQLDSKLIIQCLIESSSPCRHCQLDCKSV